MATLGQERDHRSSSGLDTSVALGFLGGLLWLLAAGTLRQLHPELLLGESWLREDGGVILTVADRILAGAAPHRDVFWQYGPLSVLPYVGIARLFGNSPNNWWLFNSVLLALSIGMMVSMVRRLSGSLAAMSVPAIVGPMASFEVIAYRGSELFLLTATSIAWAPVRVRPALRSFALGLLGAGLQATKFGSHVMAFGAVGALDVLTGWRDRRAVGRAWCWIGVGYISGMLVYVSWLFSLGLSFDKVRDVLWPVFLLDVYREFAASAHPWSDFISLSSPGIFIGLHLPLFAALVALWLMAYEVVRETTPALFGRVLLLPLAMVVGAMTIFRHTFLFHQYLSVFLLALPPLLAIRSRARWLVALLLPVILLPAWQWVSREGAADPSLETPSGVALFVDAARAKSYQTLFNQIDPEDRSLVVLPTPNCSGSYSGLPHMARARAATRFPWLAPRLVQPADRVAFLKDVLSAGLVVLPSGCATGGALASRLAATRLFTPDELLTLVVQLQVVAEDATFLLLRPVQGAPAPSRSSAS